MCIVVSYFGCILLYYKEIFLPWRILKFVDYESDDNFKKNIYKASLYRSVDVSYFLINEDSLTLLWPFTNYPSILCHYYTSKKQIPTIHDIVRIQYIIQNKTQFETVNFRLYFKVIFRQNEIQYFTQHIILYTTQREREHLWIIYWILKMSCIFGICFLLYFYKLSAGHGFYYNTNCLYIIMCPDNFNFGRANITLCINVK